MQKAISRLVLAGLFFQTQIAVSQVNVTRPVREPDEICRMILYEIESTRYEQADPACVARNQQRQRDFEMALRGWNTANSISAGNRPVAPVNNCGSPPADSSAPNYSTYHSCNSTYQSELTRYNDQMRAYNIASGETARSGPTSAQSAAGAFQDGSATGSLADMQKRNSSAKNLYTAAGIGLAVTAYANYTKAAGCASSCPYGCCPAVPGFLAAGAAFMLLNAKANKQAGEHNQSAYDACVMQNQVSSSQTNCSSLYPNAVTNGNPDVVTRNENLNPDGTPKRDDPTKTQYNPDGTPRLAGTVTIGDINPETGECRPDAPPACKQYLANNPISKIAGLDGNSKLADIGGMFKQLPDGSVQTKDGKIYTASDFANEEAMMKAGLSAADAKSLSKQLYGDGGFLAASGLDADSLLKDANKKSSDVLALGGDAGAASGSGGKGGANSSKNFKDALNASKRKPSSAGLTRNFNGDLIGASGDDIFLMMNRRYRLKNEQDSFIAP